MKAQAKAAKTVVRIALASLVLGVGGYPAIQYRRNIHDAKCSRPQVITPLARFGRAVPIRGRYAPIVNLCRKPGECQSCNVSLATAVFDADGRCVRPVRITAGYPTAAASIITSNYIAPQHTTRRPDADAVERLRWFCKATRAPCDPVTSGYTGCLNSPV